MNLVLAPADDIDLGRGGGGGLNHEDASNNEWQLNVTEPGRYWMEAQPFPACLYQLHHQRRRRSRQQSSHRHSRQHAATHRSHAAQRMQAPSPGQIKQSESNASASPTTAGERPQVWIYAFPFSPRLRGFLRDRWSLMASSVFPCSLPVRTAWSPATRSKTSTSIRRRVSAAWAGKGQTVTVDPGGNRERRARHPARAGGRSMTLRSAYALLALVTLGFSSPGEGAAVHDRRDRWDHRAVTTSSTAASTAVPILHLRNP